MNRNNWVKDSERKAIIIKAARTLGYNRKIEEDDIFREVLLYVSKRYREEKGYLPMDWLEMIEEIVNKEK